MHDLLFQMLSMSRPHQQSTTPSPEYYVIRISEREINCYQIQIPIAAPSNRRYNERLLWINGQVYEAGGRIGLDGQFLFFSIRDGRHKVYPLFHTAYTRSTFTFYTTLQYTAKRITTSVNGTLNEYITFGIFLCTLAGLVPIMIKMRRQRGQRGFTITTQNYA
jgi:hypothetical protein